MYRYDVIDRNLVDERVAQYRDQVRRFLAGELTRGRVPAAAPAERACTYSGTHPCCAWRFPTACCRQPSCACWRRSPAATTVAMGISRRGRTSSTTGPRWRTRRTSWPTWRRWKCMRSRPAATACATSRRTSSRASHRTRSSIRAPCAEILRQWSHLPSGVRFLPRKFKIAVNGAEEDRAATAFHDIGLYLRRGPSGEVGLARAGRRRHGPHAGGGHGDPRVPAVAAHE